MNVSELKTRVYFHLRQSSATSNFSAAQVLTNLNEAKKTIEAGEPWPFKELTWTFNTVASQDAYYFPSYMRSIDSMTQHTSPAPIEIMTKRDFDLAFPDPSLVGTGKPFRCIVFETDNTRIPTTGTDAAQAGTTTTSVVGSSSSFSATDDTYNDWLLINATRAAQSRISDYAGATKAFTLSDAITSQVATDTFFIVRKLNKFVLYPTPDGVYTIYCAGKKWFNPLVNDYDVPEWGPDGDEFHDAIALLAAAIMSTKQEQAQTLTGLAGMKVEGMKKALFRRTPGRISVMKSMDWAETVPALLPGNYPPIR